MIGIMSQFQILNILSAETAQSSWIVISCLLFSGISVLNIKIVKELWRN